MLGSGSSAIRSDRRAAVVTVALLGCLNLVSLADRYALPGVLPLIKAEFGVSDRALGGLSSAFFLMFMAMSPVAGWMGDRLPRKPLIVTAALVTSAAMLFTGYSCSYRMLMLHQTLLGMGEAAFAVVTPGVIADLFAGSRRGAVMSLYSLTIPVGTAAGLTLPGVGDGSAGWRAPLLLMATIGAAGTLAAALLLNDPVRGAFDPAVRGTPRRPLRSLGQNIPYLALVAAAVSLTFATVGTAVWLPSFLARTTQAELAQLSRSIGIATVVDGCLGVLLGGLLVQRLKQSGRALYTLPGASMFLALGTGLVALYGPRLAEVPAMLATQVLFFVSTAPMAVAILQVVDPRLRAKALAISLFVVHAVGGSTAPTVVGWVADTAGLRAGLTVALLPLMLGALAMRAGARAMSAAGEPEIVATEELLAA